MITTKTITFHADYNYGAVLQAYSLQRYLIENGIDNELIDIRHPASVGMDHFFDYRINTKIIIKNFLKLLYFRDVQSYRKKMKQFVDGNLKLTRRYKSHEEILEDIPQADCFICGSDQIWNITNRIRKEFFLDFSTDSKKIAYAPSFGTEYLDDYQQNYVKKALSSFYAVCARESSGADMLRSMGFENAVQCIDPVFLHSKEYWENLASCHTGKTPKGKYILVYSLHHDPVLQKAITELQEKSGYDVLVVTNNGFTRIKNCKKIIDASPFEFLNLIMNAEYVVASSFHGLAFSIIFNKEFVAYAQPLTGIRVIDMLRLVGLDDHRIGSDKMQLPSGTIDYSKVNAYLNAAVLKSEKYLLEAING